MTIRRGEAWGEQVQASADLPLAATDAEAETDPASLARDGLCGEHFDALEVNRSMHSWGLDTSLHYLDSQAKRYLVLTFGGGVNEIQRDLIAMFGLGKRKAVAA